MKKYLHLIILTWITVFISGCVAMADMAGASTQNVNQRAAASYDKTMYGYRRQGKLDTSSQTAKRIQRIYSRLLPQAIAANQTGVAFNWQLNVVKSKDINAWAMPGGKMVVYTGLAEKLGLTDAEIAAVIGHEMIHALAEHSRQQMGSKVATRLVLSQVASQVQITNSAQLDGYLFGAFEEFGMNRPFGRQMELEADSQGMILMAKAGFDPKAAISLQQKMQTRGGSGNSNVANFFSTHPISANRLAGLQANLPKAMAVYRP